MAKRKIPKPVIEAAKKYGPAAILYAGNFVREKYENSKDVDKIEKTINSNKTSHHKRRYYQLIGNDLKDIKNKSRTELIIIGKEINNFARKFKQERNNKKINSIIIPTKPYNNELVWEKTGEQFDSVRRERDFEEFLKIFNNTDYKSDYFIGSEQIVNSFKEKIANGESIVLYKFIKDYTGEGLDEIKKYFVI